MQIIVLGSAAGGGFPQWNSNSENCRRARSGDPLVRLRSQSSLAVCANGTDWFLFNASPDLRQQLIDNAQLHPTGGVRHSPLAGIVVTNADVDHIAGLLTLRERYPLSLYATPRVHRVLKSNSIFEVLSPDYVDRRQLPLSKEIELCTKDGRNSGLMVEAFPVPGKVALYLEDECADENFGTVDEDTIGLRIRDAQSRAHFFYIPACAAMNAELSARIQNAPLLFFDGTLWQDDEMAQQGAGSKTGQRMGHLSMSGSDGVMEMLAEFGIERKIFIHINNTNPVLADDAPERDIVANAGWEISYDGMEIVL